MHFSCFQSEDQIKCLCAQSVFIYLLSGSVHHFMTSYLVLVIYLFFITLHQIEILGECRELFFSAERTWIVVVKCFVYIWAATKINVTRSNERNCNKTIISIFKMKYLFYELSRRIRVRYNSRATLSNYNFSNSSRKLIKQIFHLKNTYNDFIAIPFIRSCHIVFRSCSNINKTLHHDNSSTLRGKK